MGITAIKEIRNEVTASASALVTNMANPGNMVELGGPGSSMQCDIWIPWCASHDAFAAEQFIKVEVRGPATTVNPTPLLVTHLIWQANHAPGCIEQLLFPISWLISPSYGGDFVRTTTGTTYVNPGNPIMGYARVDGNRRLLIRDSGVHLEQL